MNFPPEIKPEARDREGGSKWVDTGWPILTKKELNEIKNKAFSTPAAGVTRKPSAGHPMKLTLKTLNRPGFAEAFAKLCAEPFTPAEKFRLAQSKRALEEARADYSGLHDAAVRKFSADGSGHAVDVRDEQKLAGFQAEIAGLLAVEVDLPLAGKLKLNGATRLDANELAEIIELIEEPQ